MKKKDYQKPSMVVVELQRRALLLAGSGGMNNPDDYGNGGNPFS